MHVQLQMGLNCNALRFVSQVSIDVAIAEVSWESKLACPG